MEGYGKRILIINDNEDIQYITSGALMNREYNVFTASDGFEGSELMKKRWYDVVLVDYHMPRLNGLQFIEMCRVMWPETPIILMSADVRWISRLDSVMGTFGCIGKPFDLAKLIELVNQACHYCAQEKKVGRFCSDRAADLQLSPLKGHDAGLHARNVSQLTS